MIKINNQELLTLDNTFRNLLKETSKEITSLILKLSENNSKTAYKLKNNININWCRLESEVTTTKLETYWITKAENDIKKALKQAGQIAEPAMTKVNRIAEQIQSFTNNKQACKDKDNSVNNMSLKAHKPASDTESIQLAAIPRFLVVLLFPEEKRDFINIIARHLINKLGQDYVFFDDEFTADLKLHSLKPYLQKHHKNQSIFVVSFFEKDYTEKHWCCDVNWDQILNVLNCLPGTNDNLMALRLDQTPIPDFFTHQHFINEKTQEPNEISNLILERSHEYILSNLTQIELTLYYYLLNAQKKKTSQIEISLPNVGINTNLQNIDFLKQAIYLYYKIINFELKNEKIVRIPSWRFHGYFGQTKNATTKKDTTDIFYKRLLVINQLLNSIDKIDELVMQLNNNYIIIKSTYNGKSELVIYNKTQNRTNTRRSNLNQKQEKNLHVFAETVPAI